MKNSNMTRRALLTSIIALILSLSMLTGTTFAWFTDSVTSGNNIIVAGNLDVELSYWTDGGNGSKTWKTVDQADDLFDPNALWEPGHAEVVYLQISNEGSLALKYLFTLSIIGEKLGLTKNGDKIKLSDHLKFGVVADVDADAYGTDRAAAIAAVATPYALAEALTPHQHGYGSLGGELEPTKSRNLAIVVWMPTEVGNEANHNGTDYPQIDLAVNVLATQLTYEEDSFDNQYDAGATLPTIGTGVATVAPTNTEVTVRDAIGAKVLTASVPAAAYETNAEQIKITVEKIDSDSNVTVDDDQDSQSFEITAEGIVAGNTTPIKVELRVGTGLSGVKVFHKGIEITGAQYNETTGYVTFETTSFSPYTVTYDKEYDESDPTDYTVPVAIVTDSDTDENATIAWNNWNGLYPNDDTTKLETVYKFKAPHDATTVKNNVYKDWYCDYYVSMDRDVAKDAILLAGNYGSFGWVGFNNPIEVKAKEAVPLLKTFLSMMAGDGEVAENSGFTYADIAAFVNEFKCGVTHLDDALDGATFTVELRAINPDNSNEYITVNTVKYTFGSEFGTGTTVMTAYTPTPAN